MGYILNQLSNLPIDKNINFYIFLINGEYRNAEYEAIESNFANIARGIGDNAVLAMGTDRKSFTVAVAKKYLGEGNSDRNFVKILPAILITNHHPDKLNDSSLRLIIPLRHICKHYQSWDEFFKSLADFVHGKDDDFVKRFENKNNFLDAINDIALLHPNFFGLGLNLNKVFEHFSK